MDMPYGLYAFWPMPYGYASWPMPYVLVLTMAATLGLLSVSVMARRSDALLQRLGLLMEDWLEEPE
jgi:hypothetical protein